MLESKSRHITYTHTHEHTHTGRRVRARTQVQVCVHAARQSGVCVCVRMHVHVCVCVCVWCIALLLILASAAPGTPVLSEAESLLLGCSLSSDMQTGCRPQKSVGTSNHNQGGNDALVFVTPPTVSVADIHLRAEVKYAKQRNDDILNVKTCRPNCTIFWQMNSKDKQVDSSTPNCVPLCIRVTILNACHIHGAEKRGWLLVWICPGWHPAGMDSSNPVIPGRRICLDRKWMDGLK